VAKTVYDVAEEFLDDLPDRTDPATIEYETPWNELIGACGFSDVEVAEFEHHREWDAERIVGYVFSLSFGSIERFGDDKGAFESAVRDRLADLDDDHFTQEATVTVSSGRVYTEERSSRLPSSSGRKD